MTEICLNQCHVEGSISCRWKQSLLFILHDIDISLSNSAISKMSNLFDMNEITHNVYNRCNSQ